MPQTSTPIRASKAAVAEVFADLEPLIRRIAWRFCRRYNQDHEECVAEANLAFLKAYHTYDPSLGALETRLQALIWYRLLDVTRKEAKQSLHYDTSPAVLKLQGNEYNDGAHDEQILEGREIYGHNTVSCLGAEDAPVFDADAYQGCTDPDGRTVIGLVLDTPDTLADAIRALPKPSPRAERDCLTRYLREQGWGKARVRAAYRAAGAFLETV